ncbi:multiple RNA-binding domain-containing protein 1 [Myxozyma melibiosi]|uniref:Multiple RNA-binding domain-containing protein 1 n=1 Tax=Myxozyma melibiosi TaxID=54550 RepID=A0ABR1F5P2_9ASCO
MSRIIVRNLPLNLTDEKFKSHFADHGGVITDCKVMRTRGGQSRRFGFIGFRAAEDAVEAVRYFDKTFIGMTRIAVELAKNIGDSSVPKPHREAFPSFPSANPLSPPPSDEDSQSKPSKRRKVDTGATEEASSAAADPKLSEFLDAMKPRANERTWANDDFGVMPPEPPSSSTMAVAVESAAATKPVDSVPKKEEKEEENVEEDQLLADEGDNLARTEMTDDEWLRARRTRIPVSSSADESTSTTAVVDGTAEEAASTHSSESKEEEVAAPELTEQEKHLELIRSTRRLFLRNLSYSCSEDDLRSLFAQYGELEEVHIPVDHESHNSKGIAYILFESSDGACQAYTELDKQSFQGRLLHILPGQPKRETKLDEFELAKLPLKKQLAMKRKAEAGKSQFSWNSLYMNSDAVVGFLASKMGVSKAELLDPESADAGVRQALAEAHAIDDAKTYFEKAGVDVSAFEDTKTPRSDTVILVKNFPFETTTEEIRDMFAEHGEVRRVLVPPSNTIAIVEMADAPSGRAAFAKAAYRRMKNSILYLEKAPGKLLKQSSGMPIAPSAAAAANVKEAKVSVEDIVKIADSSDASESQPVPAGMSVSLFVKNLNFKTTTSDLAAAFKPIDGFVRAEVKTKKDPKRPGNVQSMGFGFVEFSTFDAAEHARQVMDGFVLDQHKLQIKISTRNGVETTGISTARTAKAKSAPQTKIIIKNIPFEATKKDVRQLFGAFGQLRTVRLPRKFDNTARGFAFAEFVSAKEAEAAMEALAGVHLLGRRLVLQYAAQDAASAEEEIERMQKKVRKQVAGETMASYRLAAGGKRKLGGDEDDENDGLMT